MSKIKLLEVDCTSDGTRRFQSQLYVGKDTVDFIMRSDDGVMRCWGYEKKGGFDFHPYDGEYEIFETIERMKKQTL